MWLFHSGWVGGYSCVRACVQLCLELSDGTFDFVRCSQRLLEKENAELLHWESGSMSTGAFPSLTYHSQWRHLRISQQLSQPWSWRSLIDLGGELGPSQHKQPAAKLHKHISALQQAGDECEQRVTSVRCHALSAGSVTDWLDATMPVACHSGVMWGCGVLEWMWQNIYHHGVKDGGLRKKMGAENAANMELL